MPPLPKTCPKMVLSHKGGSLCVKDAFAKKFFGVREDSAGGPLASVLRRNTLLKAGHLMRSSVVSGTVRGVALGTGTCRPDSERFRSIPRTLGCFRGSFSVR